MTHPLHQFKYCPKCGGEFIVNNEKSKRCTHCDFVYYFNPSAAVVAIIKNTDGDILVSTRAQEPAMDTLDLPGGFVDCAESSEQSVAREVMEECHLEVQNVKYLFSIPNIYRYCGFDVHTVDQFFECQVESFEGLRADDDVAKLCFLPKSEVKISDFGLSSIREGLKRYLSIE